MAKRNKYHVVPSGNGDWKVKREGSTKASNTYKNKDDAIDRGRNLAKSSGLGQLKIHKSDGTIQREYTYGKDPEKYKS